MFLFFSATICNCHSRGNWLIELGKKKSLLKLLSQPWVVFSSNGSTCSSLFSHLIRCSSVSRHAEAVLWPRSLVLPVAVCRWQMESVRVERTTDGRRKRALNIISHPERSRALPCLYRLHSLSVGKKANRSQWAAAGRSTQSMLTERWQAPTFILSKQNNCHRHHVGCTFTWYNYHKQSRNIQQKSSRRTQCFFCKASRRFWFPAEHCENHRTAQRVSPTEMERRDSGWGALAAIQRTIKHPVVQPGGSGDKDMREGRVLRRENCRESFGSQLQL